MQTGHVYKILPQIFGVVSYFPETRVFVRILDRDMGEHDACDALAREFAGRFVVADTDTRKWGEVIAKRRQGCYFGL